MTRSKSLRLAALAGVAVAVTSFAAVAQQGTPRRPTAQVNARAKNTPAPAVRRDTAHDDVRQELPDVMREVFTYDAAGRRDPFYPLLMTSELRPLLSDLVLTSVIFDPTGRRSIAVMRDKTGNMQFRVTTGMMLGRMRVFEIRPKAVYFTIQEFGSDRQDSLLLVDTTKVRR